MVLVLHAGTPHRTRVSLRGFEHRRSCTDRRHVHTIPTHSADACERETFDQGDEHIAKNISRHISRDKLNKFIR